MTFPGIFLCTVIELVSPPGLVDVTTAVNSEYINHVVYATSRAETI